MKSLILAFLLSLTAHAHDGAHGPEQTLAPNGGTLRPTKNLFFELLKSDDGTKIFAYTHDSLEGGNKAPLATTEVTVVSGKTTFLDARKKKAVEFKLEPSGDHFKLSFQPTGASRYELKLVVSYKGKEERAATWQIEP